MSETQIAQTPEPPYYAVIFTSLLRAPDKDYAATAATMIELASQQDGFLGVESARETVGITVSYWRDLESIGRWRNNIDHREAQRRGQTEWYSSYSLRVAKVEREKRV